MARHGGYMNGGYTNYQEMDTHTDDWNRPSYVGDGCSDHVCRPVIVDAEGRKRPIISYTPKDSDSLSHVPKVDRIVEHIHVQIPFVATEYKYTSPSRVEPYNEYGVVNNKWGRTSIPAQDRPQKVEVPIISYTPNDSDSVSHGPRADRVVQHTPVVVTEYKYTSPPKVEPYNEYGVVNNKWGKTSIPAEDRPQKVEEFITKVQTEVSRPARTGLLGTTNWRNPAGTNAYGEYNNFSNSDRNKPSGNRNTIRDETLADPFIVKKDGWGRESPKGWTNTPSHDTPLSRPTNDIGTAVEYLKEVVQSSSVTSPPTQPRFGAPISTVTRKEIYTETIDSREAARRYGNCNLASRPLRTEETYTGTIDSREAAKKYNGASV